jgi:transposase-like protein
MPAFQPTFCPRPACPAHAGASFRWHRDGFFRRRADGRRVQRFRCRTCRHRFSSQSFRLDFRLQKPHLNSLILACLVSKVTHRQTARVLRINRKTVLRRLLLFGPALHQLHRVFLARARRNGGLFGTFSLDELETYEHNRRLRPLTLPVLIHRPTRFVVHAEVGQIPARGGLSPHDARLKLAQGPRPSESRRVVDRCFAVLKSVHDPKELLQLVTDRKSTYPSIVKRHFGNRIAAHVREAAKTPRNRANPLFAINHTLASMRDHLSRLVRRTWAASKRRDRLELHAWIWIAWRNYVRPISNRLAPISAAMMLGLAHRRLDPADLLRWRWPERSLAPKSLLQAPVARTAASTRGGQYPV